MGRSRLVAETCAWGIKVAATKAQILRTLLDRLDHFTEAVYRQFEANALNAFKDIIGPMAPLRPDKSSAFSSVSITGDKFVFRQKSLCCYVWVFKSDKRVCE
jgi:hypothetical protein